MRFCSSYLAESLWWKWKTGWEESLRLIKRETWTSVRLYPAQVERKAGRARLHKASQCPWLPAKCTLYPAGWWFVHRACGLSCQSLSWTPGVLWGNNCTENASIISYRTICARHCLYITSSLLPVTLGGRNANLHFMEENNVVSKWQIENLNPGQFGCLSVDRCPGTGQVTIQRLQISFTFLIKV